MRKIILLLGLLLAVNNTSYAACDYSCTAPYNMNAKYKTFFSAISGYNSFVENKAESILEKEIAKFIVSDNVFALLKVTVTIEIFCIETSAS